MSAIVLLERCFSQWLQTLCIGWTSQQEVVAATMLSLVPEWKMRINYIALTLLLTKYFV